MSFPPLELSTDVTALAAKLADRYASGESLELVLRHAREFLSHRGPSASASTILLVDDSADSREMMETYLQLAGFQTSTASNGREAVAIARATRPDLILLDYAMPEEDGGKAWTELTSDDRTRAIPVIMISAFPDIIPRHVRLGCAAFVAKPMPLSDIAMLARLVLAARGAGAGRHP